MAYAPILDPLANTGLSPSDRRVALAAGAALQQLVAHGELRTAIEAVSNVAPKAPLTAHGVAGTGDAGASQAVYTELEKLKGVNDVLVRSGIDRLVLLSRLVRQLIEVRAFGALDGGDSIDSYLGPVSQLISSGRIELFAG